MIKRILLLAVFFVAIAAVSCEKEDPQIDEKEVDGIAISDTEYYGDEQNALQIALRNVYLKWIVKDGMADNATGKLDPDEYGEAIICKGRQWSKGHYNDYRNEPVLREQWFAYDKNGILRGYNFINHEMYAIDWYTTPPAPFGISTGSYPYAEQWVMLGQYYEDDSQQKYWNEPYMENPVQIDPVNQTNLTPCSKIRLPLLTKIKMPPLKCMST